MKLALNDSVYEEVKQRVREEEVFEEIKVFTGDNVIVPPWKAVFRGPQGYILVEYDQEKAEVSIRYGESFSVKYDDGRTRHVDIIRKPEEVEEVNYLASDVFLNNFEYFYRGDDKEKALKVVNDALSEETMTENPR